MTPTFALDLSLDGIRLLFRAEGGWTVVGDVALEDPALAARLSALRAEAERVAPGAVTTELVIPPSQIRYVTIPAPGPAPTDEQILNAAAGLTPLDPDDLVLDWAVDGDSLRLALLDRATLTEAETFAEAHGFNPVSFTARPAPDQFPRAPLFGSTQRAAEPTRAATPSAPPSAPPSPQPQAAPPEAVTSATVETPPAIGAEALARSLSAPHPGSAASTTAHRPASPAARRGLLHVGAVAAVLLLAVGAGFGLRSNAPDASATLLADTQPDIALEAPNLLTPAAPADLAMQPASAGSDAQPVALTGLPVGVPDAPDPADSLAPEVADTAAPAALADRDPSDAPILVAAPAKPAAPVTEGTEAIYLASIDPITRASDAISLPTALALVDRPRPAVPLAPAPAGTTFDIDETGLVRATTDGAFTPDGIVVTQGRPPLLPPAPPARAAELELVPTATAEALPSLRPRDRPDDLVERSERASLGGRTREEMADVRPAPRPLSEQAVAEAAQPAAAPSDLAVAASLLPRVRPADLATRAATSAAIAAALAAPVPAAPAPAAAAPAPQQAPVATAPARQVAAAPPPADDYDDGEPEAVAAAPNIPTSASVARQATISNAIRLRDINLIGVYGTDRDRRALVRLANGRYQKVKVGDRLDGGQIAAIGRDQLRYTKGGRNFTLTVPSG